MSLLGFAFLVLGLVLFGIATLRARVLPRWSRPLPLFMALSLTGSMPTLGILPPAQLFGYGWVLFGLALWPVDKTPPSPVPSASSSRAMLWGKVTIKLLASAILTLWTLGLPALLSAIGMTSLGWLAGRRRPALMAAWLVAGLVLGPLVVAFLRSRPYLCGPSDLWTFLWSFGHPTHLGGLAGIAMPPCVAADPVALPAL